MLPDPPNFLDQLLPDRHPQADFCICDVADAVLKDLIPQMEYPFYALSKKPETAIRVYELARKMCGARPEFEIGLEKLLKRTGARAALKRFRHTIREIAAHDHLPDYHLAYDEARDVVVFRSRGTVLAIEAPSRPMIPPLAPATYERAGRRRPAGMCGCWSRNGAPGPRSGR